VVPRKKLQKDIRTVSKDDEQILIALDNLLFSFDIKRSLYKFGGSHAIFAILIIKPFYQMAYIIRKLLRIGNLTKRIYALTSCLFLYFLRNRRIFLSIETTFSK